jgi:hypothetical protein
LKLLGFAFTQARQNRFPFQDGQTRQRFGPNMPISACRLVLISRAGSQRVQSFGILARENCPASLMATAPQAAARGTSQSKVTFLRNVTLLWILVLPRVWTQNRFPLLLATL